MVVVSSKVIVRRVLVGLFSSNRGLHLWPCVCRSEIAYVLRSIHVLPTVGLMFWWCFTGHCSC